MKTKLTCDETFRCLGECWHIWSAEKFESFLYSDTDYATCVCIIAVCSKLVPGILILTYEVMSNHIHICCAGNEKQVVQFMELIKKLLEKALKSEGKSIRWENFSLSKRKLESLEDVRNVIVYTNRNGFIVNRSCSPYTYPWGANSFFFNEYRISLSKRELRPLSLRERRSITHSRIADEICDLMRDDISVSPLCFCELDTAMNLFTDAAHYFYKLGRSIESSKQIAKECGEMVFYTDDELFSTASLLSKKNYHGLPPSSLGTQDKLSLAKTLRWEYNANAKQIARILKIDYDVVRRLFGI